MVNILRLVVGVVISLLVNNVMAFPASMQYFVDAKEAGTLGPYSSPGAGCGDWFSARNLSSHPGVVSKGFQADSVYLYGWCVAGTPDMDMFSGRVTGYVACPQNSSGSGGECLCNAGFQEKSGSCVGLKDPLCGPLEGLPLGVTFTSTNMGAGSLGDYGGKVGNPGKGCFPGGCEVQGNMSSCGSAAGNITCVLDSPKFTGEKCDPQEQASEEKPKESKCEPGKCEASINGNQMCLPCGENIGKEQGRHTETKKNPDGSTTTTKTTTTTTTSKPVFNPGGPTGGGGDGGSGVPRTDGWKQESSGGGDPLPIPSSKLGWDANIPVETKRETKRETITNADGTKGGTRVTEKTTSSQVGGDGRVRTAEETRTWIEDESGNKTSETTNESHDEKDQDKKTFCEENPKSPMCKESNFSGACGADFRCEGDAIQCSIAREQHRRNCKMFDEKTIESELYEKDKGKEGNQTKDLPDNKTEDMNNRIKTDDLLGAGGGIMDLNVTVWGQSVNLPFSQLNATIQYLGNILIAVAMLAAVRIVGGR